MQVRNIPRMDYRRKLWRCSPEGVEPKDKVWDGGDYVDCSLCGIVITCAIALYMS